MADHRPDEADVAAAWNRNAATWADDVHAGFDIYREAYTLPAFLDFMPSVEGLEVIDLGCGEGANTRRFAGRGGRMTGVDIADAMIARAREEESRAPLGIRYEVCSYSRLERISAESFDCALSTMALMDGPDFEGAMKEAHRALRPGGRLCFSILHPCFINREFEWLRSAEGAYEAIKVARYFDRTPFVEHWRFSQRPDPESVEPFEVPRFPLTLSDYVNALCEAGFCISRIEEPRPGAAAAKAHPRLARWRDHIPLVLFIAATKS